MFADFDRTDLMRSVSKAKTGEEVDLEIVLPVGTPKLAKNREK